MAIKLNPENELPKVNLADLYLITKQEIKAIPLLKELTLVNLRGVDRINVYAKLAVLQLLYEDAAQSENTIAKLLKKDASSSSFVILSQAFASFQRPEQASRFRTRDPKVSPK